MPTATKANHSCERYSAIILAGKRPGVDPVAAAHGEIYKAMVPVCGAPMLTHVAAALCRSDRISDIIIVAGEGLSDVRQIDGLLDACNGKPVTECGAKETLSESVLGAIASRPDSERFLVTTSDHPLLTPAMVDDFLDAADAEQGIAIAFVERQTIERRHPGMQRTYLPFRGAKISGANLFAFNGKQGLHAIEFFRHIERNRKSPLKMVSTFGLVNLIGFLLRAFTPEQAFQRVSKLLKCTVRPVLLGHANAAVDVDKVSDLETVNTIFASEKSVGAAPQGQFDHA